jgi:hypothetical protein
MMTTIRYVWPLVTLEVNRDTRRVRVRYADGAECSAVAGPLDHQFGKDLGCTGEEHIHAHELMHQLVGFAYYGSPWGSPVVRRAATGAPQPAQGHDEPEEKMCWTLTRMLFGTHTADPWFEPEWIRTLEEAGVDVEGLVRLARWLYDAASVQDVEEVRLGWSLPGVIALEEVA